MSISVSRRAKAQKARLMQAREELNNLRSQLADAYGLFNRTADPALLEASILEISALQVRCDRLLRSIKDLNGEKTNDCSDPHHPAGHRGRSRLPAAEAAQKADQMGL